MTKEQKIKDNIVKIKELQAVANESKSLIKYSDNQFSYLAKSQKRINDFARKESSLFNRQMDKV